MGANVPKLTFSREVVGRDVDRSEVVVHAPHSDRNDVEIRVGGGDVSKPSLAPQVVELCRREGGHRFHLLRTHHQ
jgi:hypothetical protein